MMKKRIFALLLSVCIVIGMLPITAFAAQRTDALDLTAQETADHLTTEGWKWDKDSKTLTLNGLDLSVSTGNAITVPHGTTIVLAAGSVNTIKTTAAGRPYGIFTQGDLTIISADPSNKGTLNITSTSRGIGHQSTLTDNKDFSLSISNVDLYINAAVGINMRPTNSGYDSDLNVSMSGVEYTYACSTVFQMITDKGGSCLNLTGSNITGTGDGAILISGTDTAALTVNKSTLTSQKNIYVGNNKAASAILNIQDNSIVAADGEIRIAPKIEESSSAALSVSQSGLSVQSILSVGGGYANTSVATVTDGSKVNVAGDVSIGSRHLEAITKNSKSELTVSGSTLTTERNLYVQRGEVSTMTIKDGSSVTSKGYVMVGTDTMDVEKAELTVSNSSLTAGMGDMDESIVVGYTGAKESAAKITNSTIIAVSESKGGIQLYPKLGNTGSLEASGSTFFVASLNGGTAIPDEGNNITTVQFSEPAVKNPDGSLTLPAGTTITSGGQTYTVTTATSGFAYDNKSGNLTVSDNTELSFSDGTTISSTGSFTFEPGQEVTMPAGHETTITLAIGGDAIKLTPTTAALLSRHADGTITIPLATVVQVGSGASVLFEKGGCIRADGDIHPHDYGTEWRFDGTNHWYEYFCGAKSDKAAHTAGDWIVDKTATATEKGSKHKACTVCGYTMETGEIPATGTNTPADPDDSDESNPNTGAADVPQTGDNSQPMLWLSLMAASGVALLAMSRRRRKGLA